MGQVELLPWGQTGACMEVRECTFTLLDQGLRRARRFLELTVLLRPLSLYRLWQRDSEGERDREREQWGRGRDRRLKNDSRIIYCKGNRETTTSTE